VGDVLASRAAATISGFVLAYSLHAFRHYHTATQPAALQIVIRPCGL
jgi:hypothetical protein